MGGNTYVDELRKRYIAVRKRLYGVRTPTGVVPPSQMPEKPEPAPQEPTQVEVVPETKTILVRRLTDASPRLMRIIRETCDKHGVDPHYVIDQCRWPGVVLARWEIFWRAHKELNLSYNRIAHIFKRDHTTIMHGVKTFEELNSHVIAAENRLTIGDLTEFRGHE